MNDKDTVVLLKECNSGCKAATDSMGQVLKYVKSGELRSTIESCNERHVKLGERCHSMLSSIGEHECDPPQAAMAFARAGTGIKLAINDDDSRIAELMVDGCNMGIKSLSKELNNCTSASSESRGLTSEIIREERNFLDDLLKFL